MSKKHHGGRVPPANLPRSGAPATPGEIPEDPGSIKKSEVSSQQQEPKNRIGDFTGKGDHSMQEPGGKKDANH